MIEKVNPSHPDKIADRIAGALVDLAYTKEESSKVAIEVLIGHGQCTIISEASVIFTTEEVKNIVYRVSGCDMDTLQIHLTQVPQDMHLADNQKERLRCGDNGIFKGVPLNEEEIRISKVVRTAYGMWPSDGKYILNKNRLIVCQSNAKDSDLKACFDMLFSDVVVNPLGEWTGGIYVDSGATNRKLGSDMARSVTGGGLHGKDLSKADVSINIWCWIEAQLTGKEVNAYCSIGDTYFYSKSGDGLYHKVPFELAVTAARTFIMRLGGFEKLAEWGLF